MKKKTVLFFLLAALLLLVGSGCGKKKGEVSESSSAIVQASSEKETKDRSAPDYTLTLMVYMIGSDLESGSASATNDMEEMASAGANLEGLNLVLYTGGSAKWHSDVPEDENALFLLTEEGFALQESYPLSSMGEAASLTRFLQYGQEHFPADKYALILWDHGNGPLMGYGLDKKYNNDSLTLPEIKEALAASPFGPENKLMFIGFDACLMSSAELICTVADYGEYLVASQETEPGFGWNYAFLENAGYLDARCLVSTIPDRYMEYCDAYFSEKTFFSSDVTLAAVDLSYAKELAKAIDGVFARAENNVSGDYPALAVERVKTRAFGRASTGSEYDLVDMESLMEEMSENYGEETKAVLDLLKDMVVNSRSNTENSCGVSLYYPYYNKAYYSRSWSADYQALDLFPDYRSYLSRYEKVWLGTDMQVYFSDSMVPSLSGSGSYTLQLTEEQQEHFASARYYVLRRTGDQLYTPVFVSADVTNEDGTLTANFPGKVIYVSDGDGIKTIPVVKHTDSHEGVINYSLFPHLESFDRETLQFSEIQLSLEPETEELTVKGMYTVEEGDGLSTGKRQEITLENWRKISFMDVRASYLTRDENGLLLPFFDWPTGDWITGTEMFAADGISFSYEEIYDDGYEYFIMFEVSDVQDSRYSSELLPITLKEAPKTERVYPEYKTEMKAGASAATILEEQGIKLELCLSGDPLKENARYMLRLTNDNDFPVQLQADDLVLDGQLVGDDAAYCQADPNSVREYTWLEASALCTYLGKSIPDTLEFRFFIRNDETCGKMIKLSKARVSFDEKALFSAEIYSLCGAVADAQSLGKEAGVEFALEWLGYPAGENSRGREDNNARLYAVISAENTTDKDLTAGITGFRFNSGEKSVTNTRLLPAGCRTVFVQSFYRSDLEEISGGTIENCAVQLVVSEGYSPLYEGWADIALAPENTVLVKKAQVPENLTGRISFDRGREIYNSDGVRISLIRTLLSESLTTVNKLYVENTTDKELYIRLHNLTGNGSLSDAGYHGFSSKPGSIVCTDQFGDLCTGLQALGEGLLSEVSFTLEIQDGSTYETLDSRDISLNMPAGDTAVTMVPCYGALAEEQVLADTEDVRITLLGCGSLVEGMSAGKNLAGLVRFENKSDRDIPVGMDGIAINGFSVSLTASRLTLAPKMTTCVFFNVIASTLEEEGISAIGDISLLLLTSEEELTGTVTLSGGSWYPLTLSEKGNAENQDTFGDLLLDNGEFKVYNAGQSSRDISSWGNDYGDTAYFWNLVLVNDSDENVEFHIVDVELNGDAGHPDHVYVQEDEVGAHTRRNTAICDYEYKGDGRPELSFRPQLRSLGGGTVLYTGERITLYPEGND